MKWRADAKGVAREWLADTYSADIILDVLVAKQRWRDWPSGSKKTVVSVMVEGSGLIRDFGEEDLTEDEFEAMVNGRLVRPFLTLGYADRPALGAIASKSAMLARSYPGIGLIRPFLVCAYDEGRPNTAPAYFERGIELVTVPKGLL